LLRGSAPAAADPRTFQSAGHAFVAHDRVLDCATTGPLWLKDARIADIVAQAILTGDTERRFYKLYAWAVMPNHVHMLIRPVVPVPVLTRWVKGSTARYANLILGWTGQPFWQDESFDRYLRDPSEMPRIVDYIERNPVSAGLVSLKENWRWSSAGWQAKRPAPQA
jgi:REP element-mobilizing transposase RayT